jgi:proteasome accessory factor B
MLLASTFNSRFLMAADYSRIHRLLKIISLIQGESGWTTARLALECGAVERTIYRDLQMIEAAGIPYFFDTASKGYRIRRDFFMPPVQLTLDESLALAALAEKIGGREQVPFTKAAGRAITKIRGLLPVAMRDELHRLEAQIEIQLPPVNLPESSPDVYETMQAAIARNVAVLCHYESVSGAVKGSADTFVFHPYTLLFSQRAWYAIGHHAGRDEVRCLKLNRFTGLTITDQRFTVPAAFSVREYMGNAWRMIRGKDSYQVEIDFDPEFAETISDTHWHATQEIIWNDDGSITFRCTVDGLDEIVWWVLSMGPHCVVKKPAELIHRVRAMADQVVANYAHNSAANDL